MIKTITRISAITFIFLALFAMFVSADINIINIYLTSSPNDRGFFFIMWIIITTTFVCAFKSIETAKHNKDDRIVEFDK